MKTVKAKQITYENFAPYGKITSIAEPTGFNFAGETHQFYPDRMIFETESNLALSPLKVKRPEKILISQMEMHNTTAEGLLCLDADIVIHVAPPIKNYPNTDEAEAFIIPKGTAVQINTGVWHLAPIPVDQAEANVLILLPERTYANDCLVVDLKEADQFTIEI